jgi:hypothetical protein
MIGHVSILDEGIWTEIDSRLPLLGSEPWMPRAVLDARGLKEDLKQLHSLLGWSTVGKGMADTDHGSMVRPPRYVVKSCSDSRYKGK